MHIYSILSIISTGLLDKNFQNVWAVVMRHRWAISVIRWPNKADPTTKVNVLVQRIVRIFG